MMKKSYTSKTMTEEIKAFKEKLAAAGVSGLALDIDDTLSESNVHWFEHMFKFHMPAGMTKEHILENYSFVELVPDWQTKEAMDYMQEILFSNEFNASIPLIEGADHAVRSVNQHVPIVAYITARQETVRPGTEKWLHKHTFPAAELIMRPSGISLNAADAVNRNMWKAQVLKYLYPQVAGIVDDNIGLAHQLESLGYEGMLYVYGKKTDEFNGNPRVIVCPTWADVLSHVKRSSRTNSN